MITLITTTMIKQNMKVVSPRGSGDLHIMKWEGLRYYYLYFNFRTILSQKSSRNLLGFLLINFTFAFVELLYGMWMNRSVTNCVCVCVCVCMCG